MTNRRGRAWRYPDRSRCFECRSYFGFEVVDGLYCSRRCAGVPEISLDPADWPREHYARERHSDARRPKRDWMTRANAERAAMRLMKQAYQCRYCLGWHVGTPSPGVAYPEPRAVGR